MSDAILDTFRKMISEAQKTGASLGSQRRIVRALLAVHPDAKLSTLNSYVSYARSGTIADSFRLVEKYGELYAGDAVGAEGGRVKVRAIKSDDSAVLGRLAALETALAAAEEKIRRNVTVVEVKTVSATGTSVKKVKGTMPAVYEKIVKLCSIRQNVLMVGPAGCGKTYLAKKVAEALGLSFAFVSCSSGMSEGALAGRLLPVEAGGRFAYVPAPFVDAFENGGAFLFDEFDSADGNTLTFVNAALANGVLSLPHRPEAPVARRHKDFVCLAAANTFGHGANRIYAGRNQLDGATLDRFRAGIVAVDYDAAVEEALVDSEVLAWGRKIRAAINANGLRRIMSTRVLRDFTTQKTALGYGRADWEAAYFADWSADDRARVPAN